jgi:competence protein ComEC
LLWNPFLLFDIGFQLSYSAVMGIVYFHQKFYKLLVFNNFVPDNIWQLISISFAAQIGTLPLSLYYFHAFPTWFWLSGLVAIPVSSLALYAGIVTLITDLVIPGVAEIAGAVFYWLVWLMNESIFFFQRFPLSTIQGIWLGFPEALLIVIIILLLVFVIETSRIRGIIFCVTGICLLIASSGFKETKQYFKAELAIYHINRQTLIDWTEGDHLYSFSTASLPLTKENQAAQLHRWHNRATAMTRLDIDSTSAMGYGFHYTPPVIFFRDKTLAIINKPILPFPDSTIVVDYLLLCGTAKITVPEILKSYRPGLIIADGSNSRYKVAQWKRESAEAQIPFYTTGESGAFMVVFE